MTWSDLWTIMAVRVPDQITMTSTLDARKRLQEAERHMTARAAPSLLGESLPFIGAGLFSSWGQGKGRRENSAERAKIIAFLRQDTQASPPA